MNNVPYEHNRYSVILGIISLFLLSDYVATFQMFVISISHVKYSALMLSPLYQGAQENLDLTGIRKFILSEHILLGQIFEGQAEIGSVNRGGAFHEQNGKITCKYLERKHHMVPCTLLFFSCCREACDETGVQVLNFGKT